MKKPICLLLAGVLFCLSVAGCSAPGQGESGLASGISSQSEPGSASAPASASSASGSQIDFTNWDFSKAQSEWFLYASKNTYTEAPIYGVDDFTEHLMEEAPEEFALVWRAIGRYMGMLPCDYPEGIYNAVPFEPGTSYKLDYWMMYACVPAFEAGIYPPQNTSAERIAIPQPDMRKIMEYYYIVDDELWDYVLKKGTWYHKEDDMFYFPTGLGGINIGAYYLLDEVQVLSPNRLKITFSSYSGVGDYTKDQLEQAKQACYSTTHEMVIIYSGKDDYQLESFVSYQKEAPPTTDTQTYHYDNIPGMAVPEMTIEKIVFEDRTMGESTAFKDAEDIQKILSVLEKLKIYNQPAPWEPEGEEFGSLYRVHIYEKQTDETPAYTVAFAPFYLQIGQTSTGPLQTQNMDDILKAIIHIAAQKREDDAIAYWSTHSMTFGPQ